MGSTPRAAAPKGGSPTLLLPPLPTLCLSLRAQRFAPKKPAGKGSCSEGSGGVWRAARSPRVLFCVCFFFWLSWIRPCRLLQQQRLGAGSADIFGGRDSRATQPQSQGGCGRGSPSPVEPHGREEEEKEETGLGPGPVPGPAAAVTQPAGSTPDLFQMSRGGCAARSRLGGAPTVLQARGKTRI